MTGNADQIEFWNGRSGEQWVLLQETMDRNMARIQEAVLVHAAAKPGEHILDVGCGTGTTTLALAQAVGPSGRVTGVDISKPMLGYARARAARAQAQIEFVEADASARSFKAEHDLVFSRFGVMFFDDPAAAFANIRSALKSGGRLAFVCWRAPQENIWASAPIGAALPFLPPLPPSDPLAPGPFAFADADRLKKILKTAGFRAIRIEKLDTVMNMGSSLDLAADQTLKIGPLSRMAAGADDETKAKVLPAIRKVLEPYATEEGVMPPAACWLVAAKN